MITKQSKDFIEYNGKYYRITKSYNTVHKDSSNDMDDELSIDDPVSYGIRKNVVSHNLDRLHHLDELLNKGFTEDASFNGMTDDHHIAYKYNVNEPLISKDGRSSYEFLIEYSTLEPSVGIYFGCKALIKGGDKDEQQKILSKEWGKVIRSNVIEVLSWTFGKDFTYRCKPTDNSNNNTYWPFWISLYDDENIVDLAARAVKLIYKVYKQYLNKGENAFSTSKQTVTIEPRFKKFKTYCTKDAYNEFLTTQKLKVPFEDRKSFIERGIERKFFTIDPFYEYALRIQNLSKIEIVYFFACICDKWNIRTFKPLEKDNNGNYNIGSGFPWEYFSSIFLTEHGEPLPISILKTSFNRMKNEMKLDETKYSKALNCVNEL